MPKCLVFCCKNNSNKSQPNISFFKLTKERYDIWLRAVNRDPNEKISNTNVICSEHFRPQDYEKGPYKKHLKDTAIPTLMLRPEHWPQRATRNITEEIHFQKNLTNMFEPTNIYKDEHSVRPMWHTPEPVCDTLMADYELDENAEDRKCSKHRTVGNTRLIRVFHNYSLNPQNLKDRCQVFKELSSKLEDEKELTKQQVKHLKLKIGLLKNLMRHLKKTKTVKSVSLRK